MHQGCVLVLFSVVAAIAAVFVMKNVRLSEENDATGNTGGTTEDFLPEVASEEQADAADGKPVCPKSRLCDS